MRKRSLLGLMALCVALLGSSCKHGQKTAASDKPLMETHWLLRTLKGRAIEPTNVRQEPYLLLVAASKRLNGSGGCNNLMGAFVLDGQQLSFAQVGATRMHCPGAMEVENAFLEALRATTRYRIQGSSLTLLADEAELATLEAKTE
jgi:heat shock protein HslJ